MCGEQDWRAGHLQDLIVERTERTGGKKMTNSFVINSFAWPFYFSI